MSHAEVQVLGESVCVITSVYDSNFSEHRKLHFPEEKQNQRRGSFK